MPSSYHELRDEEDFERVAMSVLDYMLKDYEVYPSEDFDDQIIYDNLIYPETEHVR